MGGLEAIVEAGDPTDGTGIPGNIDGIVMGLGGQRNGRRCIQ